MLAAQPRSSKREGAVATALLHKPNLCTFTVQRRPIQVRRPLTCLHESPEVSEMDRSQHLNTLIDQSDDAGGCLKRRGCPIVFWLLQTPDLG